MLLSLLVPFAVMAQEAYAVLNNGTLTFYYDNSKSSRSGKTYMLNTGTETPGWNSYSSSIKKVIITSSFSEVRPTSTYRWFCNASSMYQSSLSDIEGLENLNTSEVKNMSYMFYGCIRLTSLDLSHFDTRNVTTMSHMFSKCYRLNSLDVSHFNTSKVNDMQSMFYECKTISSLDLSHFDTSNVKYMYSMFYNCDKLTHLDLSHFDTGKVSIMGNMFKSCDDLLTIDLSNFDTSSVVDMNSMFMDCRSLISLDLSSFKTSRVTDMSDMFWSCNSLTTIYVSDSWTTEKVTHYKSERQFLNCKNLVGGKGTKYNANHVDVAYAHVDCGTSNPGYLTDIKDKKVEYSDDIQEYLDSLAEHSGTEKFPVVVPVSNNGITVDGNVEINKEVHLLFDGGVGEPLTVNFVGGVISINDKNSSLAFNNVIMTNNAMARGQGLVTATANSGGIVNGGKLVLTSCTVADGLITNSGSVYIDGATAVNGMTNRLGGRIYITSPMTKDISVSIFENYIETGTPIILGGNGYTLTAEDAAHISITLSTAYEWKYDASKRAIVISKKGDSNDDNVIDVADIATIISYMAGGRNGIELKQVDANDDGVVDVADIATIISIMAGK